MKIKVKAKTITLNVNNLLIKITTNIEIIIYHTTTTLIKTDNENPFLKTENKISKIAIIKKLKKNMKILLLLIMITLRIINNSKKIAERIKINF
jgi:hypothetical protein